MARSRFYTLTPGLVTREILFEQAGIAQHQVDSTPGIAAYHGSTPIPPGGSYPARHGFTFEVITDSLDHERDAVAMIQLHNHPPTVHASAKVVPPQDKHEHCAATGGDQDRDENDEGYVRHVQQSFLEILKAMQQIHNGLKTVTHWQDSTLTAIDFPSTLHERPGGHEPFFGHEHSSLASIGTVSVDIIHRWQQLANLRPKQAQPMAPVITWMTDHERFPQCLVPREVHLPAHPQAWKQRIMRAWQDYLLPDLPVDVEVVQPSPLGMEAHAVAHVLVTQQQQPGFTSILLTTVDNAMPGSYRRHATMVPLLVRRETILALAFIGPDCNSQANTCEAWLADTELDPLVPNQVTPAQSATAAIHRHTRPAPEEPDPWDQAVPRNKAFPVQICLQAVIPDERVAPSLDTQPDAPQLLWFANNAWKITLEEECACPILSLPDGMHVPDPAYWALLQSPPTDAHADLSYTLFLDGAANGHEAGWSVVIVASHQQCDHFVGCIYGTVHLNPQHPDWVGADTSDNIAAELSAMIFAQNMIMRWPGNAKVCIRPDLSLSRTVATAATTCRSNPQLAKMCCALGLWLSKQVDIHEVRGHTGNAWNELADSIAKWAMQHHSNPLKGQFEQLHQLASNAHDVNWTWMQTTHPSITACFPPLLQQQVMHFSPSNKKLGVLPTERLQPAEQQEGSTWNLQVCTANVLATEVWQSQTIGTKRTGQRTLRLDSQWHKAQLHIIGIQEARTSQGRFHAPHYHIFASGAKHKRSPLYPNAYAMVVLQAPSLATPSQENPNPITDASQWWAETSNLYTKHVTADAQWGSH